MANPVTAQAVVSQPPIAEQSDDTVLGTLLYLADVIYDDTTKAGMILRINPSNRGTVKAVSPWEGL